MTESESEGDRERGGEEEKKGERQGGRGKERDRNPERARGREGGREGGREEGREGQKEGGRKGGRDKRREGGRHTHNPLEESRGGLRSKGVGLLGSESAVLELLLAPRHLLRMSESHSESESESVRRTQRKMRRKKTHASVRGRDDESSHDVTTRYASRPPPLAPIAPRQTQQDLLLEGISLESHARQPLRSHACLRPPILVGGWLGVFDEVDGVERLGKVRDCPHEGSVCVRVLGGCVLS